MAERDKRGNETQQWSISDLSEETRRKIAEYKQEKRARKEAFLKHHQERHPIHPSTNEEGTFAGLYGYTTAVGARIFPYYRTESGVYFYESTPPETDDKSRVREKTIIQLDIDRIQRDKSAIFYTPKSFLGDEPVAKPGVIPDQEKKH